MEIVIMRHNKPDETLDDAQLGTVIAAIEAAREAAAASSSAAAPATAMAD
jgi:hypothetical protein